MEMRAPYLLLHGSRLLEKSGTGREREQRERDARQHFVESLEAAMPGYFSVHELVNSLFLLSRLGYWHFQLKRPERKHPLF